MNPTIEYQAGHGYVPLAAASGNAGMLSLANPTGKDLLVEVVVETVTGIATRTVDVGIASANNAASDNLIDGLALLTAGKYPSSTNGGTNGKVKQIWKADQFLTATVDSGTPTGYVGYLHIYAEEVVR